MMLLTGDAPLNAQLIAFSIAAALLLLGRSAQFQAGAGGPSLMAAPFRRFHSLQR